MTKNKKLNKKRSLALRMLFYWGKFLGINTFTLSQTNELKRSYLSVFYNFFLLIIYSYTVYRVVIERLNMMLPGETPISVIGDYIHIVIGFIEHLLTWLFFVIYQNRVKSIVKVLAKVENIMRKLKIADDYEKIFVQSAIRLTIVNCFYVVWIIGNDMLVLTFSDFHALTWMCYALLGIISLNTGALFVWIIIVVRQKFRRLNEKIKKFTNSNDDACEWSDMENEGSFEIAGNSSSLSSGLLLQRIDTISQVHRELRYVIGRIEEYFAPLMLLNLTRQILNIAGNVHIMYHSVKDRRPLGWQDIKYTGAASLFLIIPLILLTVVSNVCGSASEEATKTGNILHAMLTNRVIFRDTPETLKFNAFFLDLLQNRVKISLLGFIDVDYFTVYSIIATAATYITIMLQFYG